jgi:hypothetical protein
LFTTSSSAQAVDEIRLEPGALHRAGDGLAAPVHDDDVDPAGGEERDVVGDARPRLRVGVVHEAPAVLHDERGAAEILDVGEGLDEDLGLGGDFGDVH